MTTALHSFWNKASDAMDPRNLDFLGPMEAKELWQGMRRGMFVGPFILIHIGAIIATLAELMMGTRIVYDEYSGFLNVIHIFISGPFWLVAGSVCGLIMPLSGIVLMSSEMEEGNHELLQMTKLSRWSVVRGKWLALWGLCILTISSLLPYLIVRYFQGGMDIGRNIALLSTTIGLSGIISAMAVGASAYKHVATRLLMMGLLLGSALFGATPAMAAAAMRGNGCGIAYHINAIAAAFCFTILGLSLGRSRIRLKVHQFEVQPSALVTGMIIFTPFIAGIATGVTLGWYGGLALGLIGFIVMRSDVTPKARAGAPWVPSAEEGGNILNTPNFSPPPIKPTEKPPPPAA